MNYKIYEADVHYGRDIEYTGKYVLYAENIGYLGTFESLHILEGFQEENRRRVIRGDYMKVTMIGTPTCGKCKMLRPRIEKYCQENSIGFQYKDMSVTTTAGELQIVMNSGVTSAPVFLLYKDEDTSPVVVSGDELFIELH